MLLINCSILGHDVERVFDIMISSSASVNDLKRAIKKERQNELYHIDAADLDIWMVSGSAQHTTITDVWRHIFSSRIRFQLMKFTYLKRSSTAQASAMRFCLSLWRNCRTISLWLRSQRGFI